MHAHAEQDLNRAGFSATTHCLTGCAIGEVMGMVISTAFGWGNLGSFVLSIVLVPFLITFFVWFGRKLDAKTN